MCVNIWWSMGKRLASLLRLVWLLPAWRLPGLWMAWDWLILVIGKPTSGIVYPAGSEDPRESKDLLRNDDVRF